MEVPRQAGSADLKPLCDLVLSQRPLIVASNRGPVEHQMNADGRPEARRGSGSVVTSLSSLAQTAEFLWVSSAMSEGDRLICNNGQNTRIKSPLPNHKIHVRYVVTSRRVYHKYYNILCNPLLWFLQHYMWNSPYSPNVDAGVHDAWQDGYIPVNQAFAQGVIDEAQQSGGNPPIVMGHDYHLYLMPEYVRQALPQAIIQHQVHIPWPTSRYWQIIPKYIVQRICSSLCCTDLLGFQTLQDGRSFLDTVAQYLPEAQIDYGQRVIDLKGQKTQVKAYPVSINTEEVRRIATSPRAMEYEERLRAFCNESTIIRVDRAEPNKNVLRGFNAYRLLLSKHPELHGKVTFLAFLVPSRTHIRQYQRYMEEIQEAIDQINSAFGNETWKPIVTFMENNYVQAIAGMKLYDVLLVNPVIDGINLVAKEGPVVNTRNGVLVLSESSGTYPQLSEGSLGVSPADIEGTMQALYQAIAMTTEERKRRADILANAVRQEDINSWICRQLEDIGRLL